MVGLLVTNAHMGVSQFDKITTFGSSNLRLSSGFVICKPPSFSFGLKSKKVEKNHGVLLGLRNCGKISVLLKRGAVESGIMEKEFEFKPSFDEYLKAMESIKSVREKRKQAKNKKINGEENLKLGDLEDKISQEKSKFSDLGEESGVLKDARKIRFAEKSSVDDNVNVERKLRMETQNGRWTNNQNGSVREIQRYDKFEGDRFRENSVGRIHKRDQYRGERVYAQNAPQNVIQGRINKRGNVDGSDDDIENDRAAFRSFEEHNDVYDKPRVSRMDMEERIQKLAKCLNGADADMPEWMFSKMMRSAKIRFADHSMVRVIQILGKLGNWKRVLQVIEWINSRERFKSHKLRHIYTAALDALGKTRRPVEALNLFYTMQQQMSTYPDLVAYHCIAVALGQAGHMKELFDVIDSMQSPPKKKFKTGVIEKWDPQLKPDIVVYNAVLNACVHRKKWEGAFWVLQQLKEEGQQHTSATYGLIMEAMFACGKYDLVHEFFKKVQRSSIPNASTYKVLVNTHWKEGNIDKAVTAVKDMERRGIIGSSGLYYDLARSLCSAGRCKEALMQVGKICRVANKPLVVTYTGLIQSCLDSRNIQDGIYIFKHMEKFCFPNLVTCNIMLKAYLDHEMFEEAKGLFQKLVESGNHIGSKSECKDRVIADSYTFNLMLDACLVQQRWNDLEFIYRRMLQHGYHFNARRHLRIIMDACRDGKMELLETTWKHLVQADRLPPPLLVKQMFCLKLEQNDYAAAFSCATSHPASELPEFSQKSWLNFFRENSHRLKKETLVGFEHETSIITARSDSCNQIIENLNTACREFLRTT